MVMNMDAPDTARDKTDRWVEDRLHALDPPDAWEPPANIALARFRERAAAAAEAAPGLRLRLRLGRRQMVYASGQISDRASSPVPSALRDLFSMRGRSGRGHAGTWMAAATMACLLLLLTPGPRAVAQRVWDVFFAERVAFVTLDTDKLPRSLTEQRIRLNGSNVTVASVREAAEHARFTPRLPDASIAGAAAPTLQVTGTISLESRVDAADLEAAARSAGLDDLHVPAAWDDARIGIHTSPLVIATYPSFELIQLMPLAITTPPAFNLGAFTEQMLRIGGLSASAARTFSAQMAAAPFALLAVSPDEAVTLKQVRLRAGEGTIVHDLTDDGGRERTTLVWSTPDRLYAISANLSDDEMIAIAYASP
jgi:hypothetical protein